MSRSHSDVGGYRGRRTVTDILRLIAIVLAVAVVLVVAGLFFLQQYIVYTDEGPKLQLPSLFQREEGPDGSVSVPEPGSLSIIEDEPSGSQSEPDQGQAEAAGLALQLSVSEVVNGTAAARLEEAGADTLILEVKDQLGRLSWYSGQAIAQWSGVNGQQAAGDALKAWNQGDVYTVARVHCFQDDMVPYYNNNLALRWAGYDWNWRDDLGLRWTSPALGEVRAYNAALCGELAAMGFDEIVLEECYFPIQGGLENIRRGESYEPSRFTAHLEDFLTQARQAVEPYGAKISLRVGQDTLTGAESASGMTVQLLERYAYRVWTGPEGYEALTGELSDRGVKIVSQAETDSSVFQAVIPDQTSPTPIV